MWLNNKIISAEPVKKLLKDYLPKLTPEQIKEREQQFKKAGIYSKEAYDIWDDEVWNAFLVNYQDILALQKAAFVYEGLNKNAFTAVSVILKARPELVERMSLFIELFGKTRKIAGSRNRYVYSMLKNIFLFRPDLVEDIELFSGLCRDLESIDPYYKEEAYDNLGKLLAACPRLAWKLEELGEIAIAAQRHTRYIYKVLGDIIGSRPDLADKIEIFIGPFHRIVEVMQDDVDINAFYNAIVNLIKIRPDLADKPDNFCLLAEKFKENTLEAYGILLNMTREGLLAGDNFDQVVQELLAEGDKALQRLRKRHPVA